MFRRLKSNFLNMKIGVYYLTKLNNRSVAISKVKVIELVNIVMK